MKGVTCNSTHLDHWRGFILAAGKSDLRTSQVSTITRVLGPHRPYVILQNSGTFLLIFKILFCVSTHSIRQRHRLKIWKQDGLDTNSEYKQNLLCDLRDFCSWQTESSSNICQSPTMKFFFTESAQNLINIRTLYTPDVFFCAKKNSNCTEWIPYCENATCFVLR